MHFRYVIDWKLPGVSWNVPGSRKNPRAIQLFRCYESNREMMKECRKGLAFSTIFWAVITS